MQIIRITDEPIASWSDELLAPDGEVGEICVSGPSVTREYFGLPHATAMSKIKNGDATWHRIGDVGYFDELGRLWFCGRKAHRVQTCGGALFTECIEPVFNRHSAVARSALVGVGRPGRQTPVLIVELKPDHPRPGRRSGELGAEILAAAGQRRELEEAQPDSPTTADGEQKRPLAIANQQWGLFQSQISNLKPQINHCRLPILFHRSLPVDIRHNAKINREMLAKWAAKRAHEPHLPID